MMIKMWEKINEKFKKFTERCNRLIVVAKK